MDAGTIRKNHFWNSSPSIDVDIRKKGRGYIEQVVNRYRKIIVTKWTTTKGFTYHGTLLELASQVQQYKKI